MRASGNYPKVKSNLHISLFSMDCADSRCWVNYFLVGTMTYEMMGAQPLDYMPCQYGRSKLVFRGPARDLTGQYAAFLGGTETYGKFLRQPYPALVETRLGAPCVNLGWPNSGVDVLLNDPEILFAASRACVTVLQVPGAQNMSNRFYKVHPRRNDRFVEASAMLRTMFTEVDFTEFHFTRHMLGHLADVCPVRFNVVRDELQAAWIARMKLLLARIGGPVILLWMASRAPADSADAPNIAGDAAFVTRAMLQNITDHAASFVDATTSAAALKAGTEGMVHSELEAIAASELPGPVAHDEAAKALEPILRQYLDA